MQASRFIILFALLLFVSASVAGAYTGSLSVANGELDGTGFWVNQSQLPIEEQPLWTPATISWTVTQNQDQSWNYSYTLSVYRAEISHFIIETSPGFGSIDLLNPQGAYASSQIGLHLATNPGNPFLPEDLYGVKFNDTVGTTLTISFDSWRMPVWGDFYAKCGKVGGTQNTVWNLGYTDPDPTAPAANGSYLNHILVPDTVVPEPTALASLGLMGVAALGYIRRRR